MLFKSSKVSSSDFVFRSKLSLILFLPFLLLSCAPVEEEEVPSLDPELQIKWELDSITCDDTAVSISILYGETLDLSQPTNPRVTKIILASTLDSGCGGSYTLAEMDSVGTSISYKVPDTATLCVEYPSGNVVSSCSEGSFSCSTSAGSDTEDFDATYVINDSGNLVLTEVGAAPCGGTQTTVRTFTPDEED